MKIITILFILFTLVISTEIRDETTFRLVGNEEDNYVNITETIDENKEDGSFNYKVTRETLYTLAVPIIQIFVIISVSLILKIYEKYNNQIDKLIVNIVEKIFYAIEIILAIVTVLIVSYMVFKLLLRIFLSTFLVFFYPFFRVFYD